MIILRLEGGLGNAMFQYGLGKKMSLLNETDLKFDLDSYKTNPLADCSFWLESFNVDVKNHIASKDAINAYKQLAPKPGRRNFFRNLLFSNKKRYVQEKHYHFDPSILDRRGDMYLHGWWQSEKYFSDIRDKLLQDFSLRVPFTGARATLAEQIHSCNSISIHIRRLDFISNPKTRRYHGQLPTEYYEKAIQRISGTPNPTFFVFSDDIESVKKEFSFLGETVFVEKGSDITGAEDMMLMSLCKHNIIANSSFSWWGAWLNKNQDKVVIGPTPWVASKTINTKDVLPESWIPLAVNYIQD